VSGDREKAMGVSKEREEAMLRGNQVSSSEDTQGFFTRYEEGMRWETTYRAAGTHAD
jgi:hypothetical protein